MAKKDLKFTLPSVDELFTTQEMREEAEKEKIENLKIAEIKVFPNHPYQVKDDEEMLNLVESIKSFGVQTPVIVRLNEDNEYEMVSGHRRKRACELAGIDEIPAIVRSLDRDEATILMVETNKQREKVLPSEKAFSYKMRMEAMKRQGKRSDLTSAPVEQKLNGKTTRQFIADEVGESQEQIRRFVRLTNLIPEILNMVDEEKIALRPAVEISYLQIDEQAILFDTMESEDCTPSHAQAIRMRSLSKEGRLSEDVIFAIMTEEKPNQKQKIVLKDERFNKYFPTTYTVQQKEELLLRLLENWSKNKDKSR